jgi:hypothetical protein
MGEGYITIMKKLGNQYLRAGNLPKVIRKKVHNNSFLLPTLPFAKHGERHVPCDTFVTIF